MFTRRSEKQDENVFAVVKTDEEWKDQLTRGAVRRAAPRRYGACVVG